MYQSLPWRCISLDPPRRVLSVSRFCPIETPTQDRAVYSALVEVSIKRKIERTMRRGATIQFMNILNPICIQRARVRKRRCNVSNRTLHRIGYIMTSRPTAIGMDTPTNLPFWSAGPVSSTKFPRRIPMIMARRIHTARKRSSHPRPLITESFLTAVCSSG